jgi:hypothetical protein
LTYFDNNNLFTFDLWKKRRGREGLWGTYRAAVLYAIYYGYHSTRNHKYIPSFIHFPTLPLLVITQTHTHSILLFNFNQNVSIFLLQFSEKIFSQLKMSCNLPNGHKRPILDVDSPFLIYIWNVPDRLAIGEIKMLLPRDFNFILLIFTTYSGSASDSAELNSSKRLRHGRNAKSDK